MEQALAALGDALADVESPWMVIGGIAAIAHGVHRLTTDIDGVLWGDGIAVRSLLDRLRRHGFVPRASKAEAFAARHFVIPARHRPTGVDLDLSLAFTNVEWEALARRARIRFGQVSVPIAQVEDLLIFQAIAGRAGDVNDAVTLLTLHPGVNLSRVRTHVRSLIALAQAPDWETGLTQILASWKEVRSHISQAARTTMGSLGSRRRARRSRAKQRSDRARGGRQQRRGT
jgi:hypothetical protein